MATPTNRVPLGQAGTGEAFVLDQRQAMAPFQTFAALSANQAATRRAAEKAKAEEDEKIKARQSKLLDNVPKEFAFEYQQDMVGRVKSLQEKYVAKISAGKGKMSLEDELAIQQEIKDLEIEKESQDVTTKELAEVTAAARTDKELNYEAYAQEASKILFDPITGKLRPASQIKGEDIDTRLRNNYQLINRAVTLDNFVKTQHAQQMETFTKQGRFDVQTIMEFNLPVEIRNGQIVRDKNNRPKLKVTDPLLYDADSNPKIKLLLDGLMEEEAGKASFDTHYVPKDRKALFAELLQNEVYEDKTTKRSPIPQARTSAAKPSAEDKKVTAAVRRLKLIDDAFVNRDPTAFKSLVNSNWAGGTVLDVKEADRVKGFTSRNGVMSPSDLYDPTQTRAIELTVDFGTRDVEEEVMERDSKGKMVGTGEFKTKKVRDTRKVVVDTSEPGWQATVNAALNTENANVEPEIFTELVRQKYGSAANPASRTAPVRPVTPTRREGMFNRSNIKRQ